jgi:hypothetical protein
MQTTRSHSPLISAPTGEFYVGSRRLMDLIVCSVQTGDFVQTRIDPVIREVLDEWQHGLSAVAVPSIATDVDSLSQIDSTTDALSAVLWVSQTLGLPPSAIAISAGIKERTFYDWKAKSRRPRLATQGQLWLLVQLVDDLTASHSDVSRWFKSDPTLQAALRAGDFEYIATYDVNARLSRRSADIVADSGSIGADPEMSKLDERRPTIRSRSSHRTASVRRTKTKSETETPAIG